MENIGALSYNNDDYVSYIEEMIKANAKAGVEMSAIKASQDILDTLLEGAFQMDGEVPEHSTFSLHV